MSEYAFSPGGAGVVKFFDQKLASAQASFDTGATGLLIPGGYSLMQILFNCRSDAAGNAGDTVKLEFNNDTGASSYIRQFVQDINSTLTGIESVTSGVTMDTRGDSGDANYAGLAEALIHNYDGTDFNKTVLTRTHRPSATAASIVSQVGGNIWLNTAAITRVSASPSSGANWKAGSRMTVYLWP